MLDVDWVDNHNVLQCWCHSKNMIFEGKVEMVLCINIYVYGVNQYTGKRSGCREINQNAYFELADFDPYLLSL